MVKLDEVFVTVAYTGKGQAIANQSSDHYPSAEALEQFANGYQQADYIRVEKQYRYVRAEKQKESKIHLQNNGMLGV